jgi:hypothetical protein
MLQTTQITDHHRLACTKDLFDMITNKRATMINKVVLNNGNKNGLILFSILLFARY